MTLIFVVKLLNLRNDIAHNFHCYLIGDDSMQFMCSCRNLSALDFSLKS